MGENASQIEREIRQERSHLDHNLQELEHKTRALADWRQHHRNHTGLFVGMAFGAGMVLGLATLPPASKRPRRLAWSERDTSHDPLHLGGQSENPSSTRALARRQVSETWHHIAEALLAVAAARAVDFVSELVPGFRDQFDRQPDRTHDYEQELVTGR